MKTASLVFGIISISIMILAFFPCLGWINWLNFPIALTGLIISIVSYSQPNNLPKNNELTGIILCSVALVFGFFRLILGGGVL